MSKRILLLTSVLFALLSTLVTAIPGWSEVAFTRYKYGAYPTPWCCYTIFAQDYDCQGRRISQWTGHSCYNTGSGTLLGRNVRWRVRDADLQRQTDADWCQR